MQNRFPLAAANTVFRSAAVPCHAVASFSPPRRRRHSASTDTAECLTQRPIF
jgi:hypothetical protein